MNFENITHWVQIPLSWFRAVNRLLHTHGGDCITYNAEAEDGPVISLDTERVKDLFDNEIGAPAAPTSTTPMPSGFDTTTSHSKVGGTFTAGPPGGAGIVVELCCRGMDDGIDGTIFWRPFTITSDGRIYAIAAESDAMGMRTDQQ